MKLMDRSLDVETSLTVGPCSASTAIVGFPPYPFTLILLRTLAVAASLSVKGLYAATISLSSFLSCYISKNGLHGDQFELE
jgi:hypothetical protein